MADRIFPNRYQEDPLDSDLVFQGIDWDTFNQRLAAAESGEGKKVPTELLEALNNAHPEAFDEEAKSNDRKSGSMYAENDEEMSDEDDADMYPNSTKMAKKGLPPGLAKWMEENGKGKKKSKDHDDEDHDDEEHDEEDEDDAKGPMKRKGPKKDEKVKKAFVFDHPSQLSAEAVEAAEAAGDEPLKNAILAARHDRRVRLASQIETRIASEKEKSVRLAQRKAYREAIVQSVEESEVSAPVKTASRKTQPSGMTQAMKTAFAQKALAEGFPVEYIQARLGEMPVSVKDNTSEIKSVLASDLEINTKIAAASSMIKTATLSDADYSRLVDYWKNELGYGDQDWIDALFTKKYDKKN